MPRRRPQRSGFLRFAGSTRGKIVVNFSLPGNSASIGESKYQIRFLRLTPDVPHNLRRRILRRDRHPHLHMINQQVPFFDPTLLFFRQPAEYSTQVPA
jgi:hypothetical protein